MDKTIESTATRLFSDYSDHPDKLWAALEETELTKAWIPQTMDGAGLSITDVFGLIRLSAAATCAVPFAETLLASHILSSAGLSPPNGALAIGVTLDVSNQTNTDDTGNGSLDYIDVPFAQQADYIVAAGNNNSLSLFNTASLIEANHVASIDSVGSDPVGKIKISQLQADATSTLPDTLSIETINQIGALVRSAQMCGAMDAILDLTLEHTSTRQQFGRSLAKFQAIQHLLAEIAGEAAASSAIVEAAVESFEQYNKPDLRNTASAKSRSSEAAGIVAANAHQAHGAIGYTQEYTLSTYTRRLWCWREEFGNEVQWAQILGNDYLQTDSNRLTEEFFC